MKQSKNIETYTEGLNMLDLNEQSNIYGGEVILNDPQAVGNNASQVMQYIASGWNSFWSGFNQGYKEHRR
ncbi:hypothetical protein [Dyadobacter frigoris]|uniref:Bacteriocin n=1 Tax=Dyadobacter frigoris TaxID=2576211 RepID=A0A4U6DEX9_9BACT|nr:hypothetical protein [Dyadobacter frigoris]TKT93094.1 hypothetical protein FDK13_04360 [Dyadobacter frigoris]GLU55969.1 hypothetical protein Dfri01_54300 [Dyadobacter frigoris]